MIGGIVIYISITFLIFLIFLEPRYSSKGFALAGSILNHHVTPFSSIYFLYKFRSDYTFNYSFIKAWIMYSIIYLFFLLIYGLITDDYIYPFFQVSLVGVFGMFFSIVGLVMMFIAMLFSWVKIVSKK